MVQQIVAGRDGGEHRTHGTGGGLRVGGAFRGSAEDSGFGGIGHVGILFSDSERREEAARSSRRDANSPPQALKRGVFGLVRHD